MNVRILKAKSTDWKIIQRLNNQVFLNDRDSDDDLDLDWPFSKKGIAYYKSLAGGEKGYCLIAFLNKTPVGYVALTVKDFGWRKSKYVEIDNIGVDPSFRSKAVGHMLVFKAEKWAKKLKATKLYVSAYAKNKRAIGFYKKEGFYELGIDMDKKL